MTASTCRTQFASTDMSTFPAITPVTRPSSSTGEEKNSPGTPVTLPTANWRPSVHSVPREILTIFVVRADETVPLAEVARGDAVPVEVDDIDHGKGPDVPGRPLQETVETQQFGIRGPLFLSLHEWKRCRSARIREVPENLMHLVGIAENRRNLWRMRKLSSTVVTTPEMWPSRRLRPSARISFARRCLRESATAHETTIHANVGRTIPRTIILKRRRRLPGVIAATRATAHRPPISFPDASRPGCLP